MKCRRVRMLMLRSAGVVDRAAAHLESCPDCARFAERLQRAREQLRAHHAGITDSGFAARVVSGLTSTTGKLGWAALRLLPATAALALVLLGWCWWSTPAPSAMVEQAPSDDLLTWVLEEPTA